MRILDLVEGEYRSNGKAIQLESECSGGMNRSSGRMTIRGESVHGRPRTSRRQIQSRSLIGLGRSRIAIGIGIGHTHGSGSNSTVQPSTQYTEIERFRRTKPVGRRRGGPGERVRIGQKRRRGGWWFHHVYTGIAYSSTLLTAYDLA